MPGIGALFPLANPSFQSLRHHPIQGFPNYIIFYLPTADGIEVVRVLHGALTLRVASRLNALTFDTPTVEVTLHRLEVGVTSCSALATAPADTRGKTVSAGGAGSTDEVSGPGTEEGSASWLELRPGHNAHLAGVDSSAPPCLRLARSGGMDKVPAIGTGHQPERPERGKLQEPPPGSVLPIVLVSPERRTSVERCQRVIRHRGNAFCNSFTPSSVTSVLPR